MGMGMGMGMGQAAPRVQGRSWHVNTKRTKRKSGLANAGNEGMVPSVDFRLSRRWSLSDQLIANMRKLVSLEHNQAAPPAELARITWHTKPEN